MHPAHRGRGHARRMIQLIEAELFEVTAQQMAKRIDPPS
ncbi:GNAT family N-acetyltransferase [Micromonospora sp. NBC_00617]